MMQLQEVSKNLNTVRSTIYSIEDYYKTISHLFMMYYETTLHDLILTLNFLTEYNFKL